MLSLLRRKPLKLSTELRLILQIISKDISIILISAQIKANSTMKITVTTLADLTFSLEVPEDLELENFKAFCEVESGLPGKYSLLQNKNKCNPRIFARGHCNFFFILQLQL